MSDLDTAVYLIDETFVGLSGRDVKEALGAAFTALERHEKKLPPVVLQSRNRRWTERRVRALWNREARRVDHYEIQDLTAVAVEEARLERQRLKARQGRIDALLAAAETRGDSEDRDAEGGRIRGMDMPGVGFTDADERASQSDGWGR